MSVRRLATSQPERFAFTPATFAKVEWWLKKYPPARKASAVIPVLWLIQKQEGWVSEPAIQAVARLLEMPTIRVLEVATFYTMFNLEPVGKHFIQLCGTTPCMLRGAEDLKDVCKRRIGPKGKVTADGKFSWIEVECLGACVNAPMIQINDDYYEDLSLEILESLLDRLTRGETVPPGPQINRQTSAPEGGAKTLLDPSLFDGSRARPFALPNLPEKPKPVIAPEPAPIAASPAPIVAATPIPKPESAPAPASDLGERPPVHPLGEAKRDDLQAIVGIGPKIDETLRELGVHFFAQIAAWTPAHVAWIDNYISFKGRVTRERWIEQAQAFAAAANKDKV